MSSLHERTDGSFLTAFTRTASDRHDVVDAAGGGETRLQLEIAVLAYHEKHPDADGPPESVTPNDMPTPGDVVAGRYRLVGRIARDGTAEVWRADDLVLEVPVTLTLVRSAGFEARARILNELRLARRITHPAVCRVVDIGETTDGRIFCSTERAEGEGLDALLGRVGRLAPEEALGLAHQLCDGLAAAHEQGVLHRHLEPAQVLIDGKGRVRITGFGIGMRSGAAGRHTPAGAPGYQAPEQRSPGTPLSEQTDLYTLGVVLYEMLMGERPADRPIMTDTFSPMLVQGVDPRFERVIRQALALDPRDRPVSAAAMAASLPAAPSSGRRMPWWIAGAVMTVIVGLAASGLPFLLSPRSSALAAQDTVVLTDFINTTGDPAFDGGLKAALAAALAQSPFVKVLPDERVRETLQRMERSPDERMTPSLARDIARRQDVKALLAGSIAGPGPDYVLGLEAINAETGSIIAREQIEVTGKAQVLASLGRVAAKLRETLDR